MKTIFLMRHSIPEKIEMDTSLIPLSKTGKELAKSKRAEFSDITYCYSSPYKRTVETAELLADHVIVVEKLHERIIGDANDDFWLKQYQDHDFKNRNGESLNEVKERMASALTEVIRGMREGEKALVVSHTTAICGYLLNNCEIKVTDASRKCRKITFKNKEVMDSEFNPTSYFEIRIRNNEINSIRFHL